MARSNSSPSSALGLVTLYSTILHHLRDRLVPTSGRDRLTFVHAYTPLKIPSHLDRESILYQVTGIGNESRAQHYATKNCEQRRVFEKKREKK